MEQRILSFLCMHLMLNMSHDYFIDFIYTSTYVTCDPSNEMNSIIPKGVALLFGE